MSSPRCIIGAVTMKMMSRTSMTSTSGTTLISERVVPTRAARPRRPRPPLNPQRVGWMLGIYVKVPLGDIQELERELFHA